MKRVVTGVLGCVLFAVRVCRIIDKNCHNLYDDKGSFHTDFR